MSELRDGKRSSGGGSFGLWLLIGVLVPVGLWLAAGGAWLLRLGGSPYYLIAGGLCLAASVKIAQRRKLGFWLYMALFAGTLVWALVEVGPHFWLLLPRIGGPLVVALYMLTPWVTRPLGITRAKPSDGRGWRRGVAAVGAVALVAALAIVYRGNDAQAGAGVMQPATGTDWPVYGGTAGGTRFADASQITPDNVGNLKVAWTYRTGDLPANFPNSRSAQMFEATPLKVGDTLFLCTPRDIVIALDAETGREKWRHDPKTETTGIPMLICRGVAYHEAPAASVSDCPRRILVATVDARMIALDADTGKRCQSFGRNGEISLREGMGAVKPGFHYVTSPATIVGNAAIIGGFILDNMAVDEPSGVVRAFDAISGKQSWAWDSGRADGNAPLKPGESYTRGSPNAWSLFSADPKLGLVYVPTGNPTPDHFGGQRSAEIERYGSSVVALDAATGKLRWAFQTVHHDLWDYDVASQPVLFDMPVGGQTVPALIQATKHGETYLLDRRTGRPLSPVEEQPVPQGNVPGERYSPTQPMSVGMPSFTPPPLREADMWGATPLDQLWCRIQFRSMHYRGKFTPPSEEQSLIFPGNNGIMNWGSVSVDQQRQIMVVPTSYMPLLLKLIPRKDAPAGDNIVVEGQNAISPMTGAPYAVKTARPFLSAIGLPCNAPPWGQIAAVDLKTKKVLWQRPLGTTADHAPLGIAVPGVFNQGGAITTAGGVIFIGAAMDNYLRAFDLKSGKELWKGRLPAGGQALPMSYVSARSGKQFVVIASGGHQFMNTKIGDYVVAYSLPDATKK